MYCSHQIVRNCSPILSHCLFHLTTHFTLPSTTLFPLLILHSSIYTVIHTKPSHSPPPPSHCLLLPTILSRPSQPRQRPAFFPPRCHTPFYILQPNFFLINIVSQYFRPIYKENKLLRHGSVFTIIDFPALT